jgi:hypothetical protein
VLFFVRRRWAVRVLTETGLPIRGPTATLLIDLIVWGAKQSEATARAAGQRLPKAESVLLMAMGLHRNPTVASRMMRSLPLTQEQASQALDATRTAARVIARAYGFDNLVALDDAR